MALEILTHPDDRLKRIATDIEQFDSALTDRIQALNATFTSAPGAVGIAAPQIGMNLRIIIVDVSSKKNIQHHGKMILINPEIITWEGNKTGREGCLSIPDYTGNVVRATHITIKAFDAHGKALEIMSQGYEARALQHEIDHLNGILFLDRLISRRSDLFKRQQYP